MKRATIGLIIIVGLAAGVRWYGLSAKSLWYDEAVSAAALDYSLPEIAQRKADSTSVHPPLYFLLLKAWSQVFGDTEFALRSLAAVCGLCTVVGVYLFVRELCLLSGDGSVADAAGLLAALLTAVHPLHIVSSQQVRGYTLGTSLLAWSGWLLIRAISTNRVRGGIYWVAWGVVAVLLCYTSNLATLSILAQGLFAAIYVWHDDRVVRSAAASVQPAPTPSSGGDQGRSDAAPGSGQRRQIGWALVGGAVILCAYVVPWASRLQAQASTVRNTTAIRKPFTFQSIPEEVCRSLDGSWATPKSGSLWQIGMSTSLVVILFLYLAVLRKWAALYLLLTGLLPVALIVLFSAFSNRSIINARYFTFGQLMWLSAIAYVALQTSGRTGKALLGTAIVGSCAISMVTNCSTFDASHQPGIRGAMQYALAHRGDGEPLIARERHTFFGMKYYSRHETAALLLTDITDRSLLRGGYEMRDRDLIRPQALLAKAPEGLWVFTTDAYNTPQRADFQIPECWQLVESRHFRQDYFWEGLVKVRHYRHRSASAGCVHAVARPDSSGQQQSSIKQAG